MTHTSETVFLCLRGHGEFHGQDCPACEDGVLPQFLPMTTFEYDLSYYGGNYDDVGAFLSIPEVLVEYGKEKEAFEAYTGFNQCHIITHYDEEESELEGERLEWRLDDIAMQQSHLKLQQENHQCAACDSVHKD